MDYDGRIVGCDMRITPSPWVECLCHLQTVISHSVKASSLGQPCRYVKSLLTDKQGSNQMTKKVKEIGRKVHSGALLETFRRPALEILDVWYYVIL